MTAFDSVSKLAGQTAPNGALIYDLPDEILIHVLWFLDIPELYATSRVGSSRSQKHCVLDDTDTS